MTHSFRAPLLIAALACLCGTALASSPGETPPSPWAPPLDLSAPAEPLAPPPADDLAAELAELRKRVADLESAASKAAKGGEKETADAQEEPAAKDKPAEKGDEKDGKQEGKDKDKKASDDAVADLPKKPVVEWVDVSQEKWNVRLGGHVQMDFVHWASTDSAAIPAQDYFEFRRLRLLADGVGYGVYDFRLQIDIEPEGEDAVTTPVTVVKDAYFSVNELPIADRFRIGNFFVPFSLEQVTNDTNNIFVERSIPTQGIFAADREVGLAWYGVNDAQDFTWTTGVFLDSISEATKERLDDNQGHRLSGRLTWLPYYDEPSGGRYLLHTGIGALYTDDQDNSVRFSARPQVHEGPRLIDSGAVAATEFTAANAEAALVWGRTTLQGEAFVTNVNRVAAGDATLYGAYTHVSYFLTGENRVYERFGQHGAQFTRSAPYTNFFRVPGCCGWGGWEAKARYSYLGLEELGSGQYHDVTAGFNWYWSDRVRVMFDWIHPMTSDDSDPFGGTSSDVVATRFDFNW